MMFLFVLLCFLLTSVQVVLCGDPPGGADATCAAGTTCGSPKRKLKAKLHPYYETLIREYPFQPVMNQDGRYVNIILVRSPFHRPHQEELYRRYNDKILFLGISSYADFPLPPAYPYARPYAAGHYAGMFPGFLHMFREPERIFPAHVKLLLMSQSDFALPAPPPRPEDVAAKKYDFTFSGNDQDVAADCGRISVYWKNWTFVKEALRIMCGKYKMTGVLVATKDKQNRTACTIPKKCKGRVLQTPYLPQHEYFSYLAQSRFAFVPQVHDASPRVTTQALTLNVPLLVNRHIQGGWKYVNDRTGEFFTDISDFRASLDRLMRNLGNYSPQEWVLRNYGDEVSGARLKRFVVEHFGHRVKLPKGTTHLIPTGA